MHRYNHNMSNQTVLSIIDINIGDYIFCNNDICLITKKSKRLRFPRKNIYFYVVHAYMESVKKERSYIYRECDKCILLQNYRMKIVV